MKREMIGLNTYLYTFDLEHKKNFLRLQEELKDRGNITVIYIENGYAFEIKLFRVIG